MTRLFKDTRSGRVIKIITEFLETKHGLESLDINNTIAFFGSARITSEEQAKKDLEYAKKNNGNVKKAEYALEISAYYEKAYQLAKDIATWSKRFSEENRYYICTGAGPGIMEASNKGAKAAGERTLGLNIDLPFEQSYNKYLEPHEVFSFQYFFLRKFWFTYFAKAIVVFPGGFGTLDELFENLTLLQTEKVTKKVPIVLIGKEFFKGFADTDLLIKYSLISEKDKDLFMITDDIQEAFNYITHEIEK